MDTASWIAVYLPIFVVLFIILPQQQSIRRIAALKKKKMGGMTIMTNEVIKKYVGMDCYISTGTFGTNVNGRIIDINENWIEVETKKGVELVNAEYVQSIKVINK